MMLATVEQLVNRQVRWSKYNLATGMQEVLQGRLLAAGIAHNVGGVEYSVVEDADGREWITLASCIMEVVV